MLKSVVFFLVTFNSFFASANYKQFFFDRLNTQPESFSKQKKARSFVQERLFSQKLDHFNKENDTEFAQRWYLNNTYAKSSDAPVFLYICGESTCHSSSVERGAITEYAKRFNGVIVALEHRYYGKSQPFSSLTTKNLKYLSTDQAIEDLAYFQKQVTKEMGLSGQWVAVGGSYPGNLAAYYRLKHPKLVEAALASSAPVKAEAEFDEYDAHVTKVVGPQCAALMKEAVREIEESFGRPEELMRFKKMFKSESIEDNVDFLYVVADIGAIAAQYGYVPKFCDTLASGQSAVEGYAEFANYIYGSWRLTPEQISIGEATSLDPEDYVAGFGMRQWLYQSCTEYGFWQVAHKTDSSRSPLIDMDYHNNICKRLFGIENEVNTTHINTHFYADLLDSSKSSNILFTNGSTDPWMTLSLLPEQNTNSEVQSHMIEGAAHCDDLRASSFNDSEDMTVARMLFIEMLEGIL